MKSLFILVVLLVVGALSSPSYADEQNMPTPATTPQFESIKSLAGTWVGEGKMHGKTEATRVEYRVTSNGTAVEEIFFPGSSHEMVSMYFLDGEDLMMTHYCALGNQPRMKASESKKSKKGEVISLKMVDATGMKSPQDPHMGALTLTIKGKDHLVETWEYMGPKGKEVSVFTYQRAK